MSTNIHPTTERNPRNTDRLLRWRDVEPIVGICRSHAHQLIAKGLFPKPRKLVPGGRASAWPESEITAWVQQRIASSGDEKAA